MPNMNSAVRVYISNPPNWTEEQFRKWAPTCDKCGALCRRYRWTKKLGYRCDGCDQPKAKAARSMCPVCNDGACETSSKECGK